MKNLHVLTKSEKANTCAFQGKTSVPIPCVICKKRIKLGEVYVGQGGYERHLSCVRMV